MGILYVPVQLTKDVIPSMQNYTLKMVVVSAVLLIIFLGIFTFVEIIV